MNSFTKYDYGTLASQHFEHVRRNDADFRRKLYDLRTAMYKTSYKKEFDWPEHVPKCNICRIKSVRRKSTSCEDRFERLCSPKIIHRNLSDNKRIEPPLEYSKRNTFRGEELKDDEKYPKSLYQESYINRMPSGVNKKEETQEEWIQKWKNECHNVRDTDDFVQNLSSRIINAQKILLQKRRIDGN